MFNAYYIKVCLALVLQVVFVQSVIEVRRGGWLDRLIDYHKDKFYNDFQQIAPIKINATIIPMPDGYTDSKLWDFESVMRLLVLLKDSEVAADVLKALRQILVPARRFMMDGSAINKYYPSLVQELKNDIHHDYAEGALTESSKSKKSWRLSHRRDQNRYRNPMEFMMFRGLSVPGDTDVIVVTNPVEAKLPSAQISIKLLKYIMIRRAIAARSMPTTSPVTIHWVPMNKSSSSSDSVTTDGQTTDLNHEKQDKEEGVTEVLDAETKSSDAEPPGDQEGDGSTEAPAIPEDGQDEAQD